MEHFVMDLALPIAGGILFVSTLLLGLICKLAKMAPESLVGVKALPTPFASRKEYLTAALEMDLDEFLKRAHVTPTHIKYSCPEQKVARENLARLKWRLERDGDLKFGHGGMTEDHLPDIKQTVTPDIQGPNEVSQVVNNVIDKFSRGLGNFRELNELRAQAFDHLSKAEVLKRGFGPCPVGAQGMTGLVGIPGVPGGIGCISPDTRMVGIFPRKQGCWYRSHDGDRLIMLVRFLNDNTGSFLDRVNSFGEFTATYLWSEVELALPRLGEKWRWRPCSEHGVVYEAVTFVVTPETPLQDSSSNKYVLCGCLVPFEFGKGKIGEPGPVDVKFPGGIDSMPHKQDCWYRAKGNGKLVVLLQDSGNYGEFEEKVAFLRGRSWYFWSDVELAIPRLGETWTYSPCQKHAPARQLTPFVVDADGRLAEGGGLVSGWVLCGCLVPFEFGEGKIQG